MLLWVLGSPWVLFCCENKLVLQGLLNLSVGSLLVTAPISLFPEISSEGEE